MATLFVDKLDPQSGTALEIGTSGDTVTVPAGATFNVAGTLQSGGSTLVTGKLNQIIYQNTVFDSTHSSDTQVATLSITPSATSSTILIMSTLVAQPDDGEYASVDIYRGTLASGSKVLDAGDVFFNGTGGAGRFHYTFSYVDSPSTTSAQSYSIVASPQFSASVRFGCGASNMLQLWEILA